MVTVRDDAMPEVVRTTELEALAAVLDEQIPAKALDRNFLLATWNIRNLGPSTPHG